MMIAPVSAVPEATLPFTTVRLNEPAATALTTTSVLRATAPERIETTTTSPITTSLFVTTNTAEASAASEVLMVVILPERALTVTPVARSVICVTSPPPREYPIFAPALIAGS